MSNKPLPAPKGVSGRYWTEAAQGRLVVQRCKACGGAQAEGRLLCRACGAQDLEWIQASGRGTVYSYTVVQRGAPAAFQADAPYTVAIIELAEGARVMGNILQCPPGDVRIGMPVQVVFEQRGEVKVPQFVPAGGAS